MIIIDHTKNISLDQVVRVGLGEETALSLETRMMLAARRDQIVKSVQESGLPAYGFNRGFGSNVDKPVDSRDLERLQRNLIRSHACGVGPAAPREVVRSAMFLRAVSLSRGHSGVRPDVVQQLVDFLNHGLTPEVPMLGSVGASGDLAPLSHIALCLMGEGRLLAGPANPSTDAVQDLLAEKGMEPLRLEMKEGLALNNGMQFTLALAIHSLGQLELLMKQAVMNTALAVQVLLGSDTPFREDLHALRPHPGAVKIAQQLTDLMKDSPIRGSHRQYDVDGVVQDPYSLRCSAQILGACQELLDDASATFTVEANSVTDNPILLLQPGPDGDPQFTDIISGGHFHGMPLATRIYGLFEAMAVMARLANMRCNRFVDSARNRGLGHDLKWPHLSPGEEATSSAMMIPEYVSAALTNHIWGASMPSHLFSLSTDAGQEDHVSMAAGLAYRLHETLPRLTELLAIELAYCTQAAAIRRIQEHFPSKLPLSQAEADSVAPQCNSYMDAVSEIARPHHFHVAVRTELQYAWGPEERMLSPKCQRIVDAVAELFPPVTQDRFMATQLAALTEHVALGRLAG